MDEACFKCSCENVKKVGSLDELISGVSGRMAASVKDVIYDMVGAADGGYRLHEHQEITEILRNLDLYLQIHAPRNMPETYVVMLIGQEAHNLIDAEVLYREEKCGKIVRSKFPDDLFNELKKCLPCSEKSEKGEECWMRYPNVKETESVTIDPKGNYMTAAANINYIRSKEELLDYLDNFIREAWVHAGYGSIFTLMENPAVMLLSELTGCLPGYFGKTVNGGARVLFDLEKIKAVRDKIERGEPLDENGKTVV